MGFAFTLLYLVSSYLRPFDFFPELAQYRIMLALGLICGIGVLYEVFSGSNAWLGHTQTYVMTSFAIWVGLSVALQGWLGGAALAWQSFGITALTFFFTIITVNTMRRVAIVAGTIVVCSLFLAVQGIAAYHFGWNEQMLVMRQSAGESINPDESDAGSSNEESHPFRRIRSLGFMNDPNDFAQTLILALPMLGLAWGRGGVWRLIVFASAGVILYAVYLTFSRGAAFALGAVVFFTLKDRWGNIWAAVLALLGGSVLLVWLASGRAISVSEESSAGRLDAWGVGLEMLRSHPLAGTGFNTFLDYNDLTAHNSFVLCFAELGLIGYFLWLALLVGASLEISRTARNAFSEESDSNLAWARALRNSLFAYLAAAFFLSRTYSPSLYVLLGMIAAFGMIQAGSEQSSVPSTSWSWTWRTAMVEATSISVIYGIVVGSRLLGRT